MKNALVILAGGKGKRFGQKIPKQFLKIGNTNFLNYFISNLDLSNFDIINISIIPYGTNMISNSERLFAALLQCR